MKNRYCFDVEVFPNFFCCTFVRTDTKEVRTFVIWKDRDERKEMLDFLSESPFLVSFNGLSYDLPVLRFIQDYNGRRLNADLFELSSRLVNDAHHRDADIMALRYPRSEDYVHLDLMAMMNFLRTGVGLKQCSINLKWHKVQDLPLEYDHVVEPKDVPEIVSYNVNDTFITLELYNDKNVKEARELRESLAPEYGNEILSAAKSKIANIILEKLYIERTGIERENLLKLRTPRGLISFEDVIFPNIEFKSQELQDFLSKLKRVKVYPQDDYKFSTSIMFKGNKYNFGIGGLHTDEKPAKYLSDDEHKILSMDVASFYPAIMCEYDVRPKHLTKDFIDILSEIKRERIVAKKAKDNMKAETYKIVLNSTFGKLGFYNFYYYDPFAMISVTLNGQLFLMMLAEELELNGIHVLTGNTDGLEVMLPVNLQSLATSIAKEWETKTKFELEFNYYKILCKRDVNNYFAVTSDGKKKEKGAFLTSISLEKGYLYPIVPKAVQEYFLNDVPLAKTIFDCKDIFDFCISKKSAKEFVMELKTIDGIEEIQKTNRFYISTTGASLQKRKNETKSTTGLFVGKTIQILNDYDKDVSFDEYQVNRMWYVSEAQKMVDEIVGNPNMFSIMTDFGSYKNMLGEPVTKKKKGISGINKPVTFEEVSNAYKRRIKYNVPDGWAFVVDLNTTWSPVVESYFFKKGIKSKLKIKKTTFAKSKLSVGDFIFISEIEKKPKVRKEGEDFIEIPNVYDYWINSYEIIQPKLEDFKRNNG